MKKGAEGSLSELLEDNELEEVNGGTEISNALPSGTVCKYFLSVINGGTAKNCANCFYCHNDSMRVFCSNPHAFEK